MNSLHSILSPILKKDKKKKAFLLFIIVGSVALITMCGNVIYSIVGSTNEHNISRFGEHHADFIDTNFKKIKEAATDPTIDHCGIISSIGYANFSDYGNEIVVGGFDDNATKLSRLTIIAGRMPNNSNEIAIDKSKCYKMGVEPNLGNAISIEMYSFEQPASVLNNSKTYKIVGIIDDFKNKLRGGEDELEIPSIYLSNESINNYTKNSKVIYHCLVKMKENKATRAYINSVHQKLQLQYKPYINVASYYKLKQSPYAFYNFGVIQQNYSMAIKMAILLIILLLAFISFIFIYFSVEYHIESKSFGLLRAIGTTQHQLARVLFRDILNTFIFGIIAGIAAGMSLSLLCLTILDKITYIEYQFYFNWLFMLYFLSVITLIIFVAVWSFLTKVCRVSPVEGIKSIDKYTIKYKKKKYVDKLRNITDFTYRYLSLFKTRTVLIILVMTICMSTCLCLVSNNILIKYNYFDRTYNEFELFISSYDKGSFTDLRPMSEIKDVYTQNTVDKINELPGVKRISPQRNGHNSEFVLVLNDKQMSEYFTNLLPDYERIINNYYNNNKYDTWKTTITKLGLKDTQNIMADVWAYFYYTLSFDSYQLNQLKPLIDKGELNIDALKKGEEVILCLPPYKLRGKQRYFFQYDFKKIIRNYNGRDNEYYETELKPGDKIVLARLVRNPDYIFKENDLPSASLMIEQHEVKIGAIIHKSGYLNLGNDNYHLVERTPSVYFHNKAAEKWTGSRFYDRIRIELEDDANRKEVEAGLDKIVRWFDQGWIYSRARQSLLNTRERLQNSAIYIAIAFCVGIINILSIYFVISTSLIKRKKQFGLLRSVGMSKKQLKRILIHETIFYGIVSTILSSIICIIYAFLHFNLIDNIRIIVDWYYTVPWAYIPLLGLSITGLIYLITAKKINSIVNQSVITNIQYTD